MRNEGNKARVAGSFGISDAGAWLLSVSGDSRVKRAMCTYELWESQRRRGVDGVEMERFRDT